MQLINSMFIKSLMSLPLVALVMVILSPTSWALPLSPGDRIRITIPSDEAIPELPATYRFSGLYEVNLDGTLQLPLIEPLAAAGLELSQVQQELTKVLIDGGFFHRQFLQVSVHVVDWGPIEVNVSGAIFEPGRVLLEDRFPQDTSSAQTANRPQADTISGEYPEGRYLTAAIRKAGGLAPTADIENIRLVRNNQERTIDLSGILTGDRVEDIALIAGDRVLIPQLSNIQNRLVRPSQITPSAIAVYLASQSSSGSTGNGRVAQFDYGSRFSQAAVAANCAGGSRSTNARRRIALVQTDRLTGETQVYSNRVEELLQQADNNEINPFLMPGDSIVCYDSPSTNISNIFGIISNIFNPLRVIDSIFFNNN
jgi:polysaccharide biosynthesis/export protein